MSERLVAGDPVALASRGRRGVNYSGIVYTHVDLVVHDLRKATRLGFSQGNVFHSSFGWVWLLYSCQLSVV